MEELVRHAAEGRHRLVFPSEVAAAWWRREAAARCGRPVWERQFVSWDRFKETAFDIRSDLRPCNATVRRAFAQSLIADNGRTPFLRRIIPKAAAGSTAFVPVLTAALPGLAGFAELPESVRRGLSDDLIDDVHELTIRYQQFLTRHGLYETADLARHAPLATAERWVLIAPELADDYPPFADRLTAIPSRTPAADPARLQVYRFPAFADELGWVFAQIAELLDRGVEQSQIALTVGGLEESAERLDEEAERYEIPLRIRQGRPLLETIPGRFFEAIGPAAEREHDLDSLETLLLQPGVPWQDAAGNRRLIARLVAAGRLQSRRISGAAVIGALDAIARAADFRELRSAIYRFLGEFVNPDGWGDAAPIVQRCIEELNRLIDAQESVGIAVENPYRFWIDELGATLYAERHHGEGIGAYPYRVSALIEPEHHFVIGASSRATTVSRAPFPWLTDPERMSAPGYLAERDLSSELMASYAGSGRHVAMTWSDRGLTGPSLPAAWLVASGHARLAQQPDPPVDRYRIERESILDPSGDPVYPLQRRGAEELAQSYPTRGGSLFDQPLDASTAGLVAARFSDEAHPTAVRLSAKHVGEFAACPFSFAFSSGIGLREESYVVDADSPREIGTLYHRILERYYKELQTEALTVSAEPADQAVERLLRHADEVFAEAQKSTMLNRGVIVARRRLFTRIAEWVVATDRAEFVSHRPLFVEDWQSLVAGGDGTTADVVLYGRIDRVTEGPDGAAAIIDYKKGKLPKQDGVRAGSADAVGSSVDASVQRAALTEVQLPFYSLLVERSGRPVTTLGYYALEEGSYGAVVAPAPRKTWMSGERFAEVRDLTGAMIAQVAGSIRAGDYRASRTECAQCALRGLCRTRFVVR